VALRRRALILLFAAFAVLFAFFPAFTGLLTDWWWFREIGYQIVFTRELTTRVLLFLAVGGSPPVCSTLNLRIAQRGVVPYPIVLRLGESAPRVDVTRALPRLSLPVSLILGVLAGLVATGAWDLVLRVIYRTPFGITDPVFSRDIAFYVFALPGLAAALGFLSTLTTICLLLLVPLYWLRRDLVPGTRLLRVEPSAGLHIAVLLAVLFLLTGLRLWVVDIPSLLYSNTGPLIGASYTDLHARLPALRLTAVLALLAGAAILIGAVRGQLLRYALFGCGRLPGGGLHRTGTLSIGDAEAGGGTDRADSRDALPAVSHRRHPPGLGSSTVWRPAS
jgi:Uncharacterized conserved protein